MFSVWDFIWTIYSHSDLAWVHRCSHFSKLLQIKSKLFKRNCSCCKVGIFFHKALLSETSHFHIFHPLFHLTMKYWTTVLPCLVSLCLLNIWIISLTLDQSWILSHFDLVLVLRVANIQESNYIKSFPNDKQGSFLQYMCMSGEKSYPVIPAFAHSL